MPAAWTRALAIAATMASGCAGRELDRAGSSDDAAGGTDDGGAISEGGGPTVTGAPSSTTSGPADGDGGDLDDDDDDGTSTSTSSGSGADEGVDDWGTRPDVWPIEDCDLFAQDCPPGHKCMPWANDGGGSWNATICTPVADDPGQPGEPCTVEGSGLSGIDDCDLGAMCWDVDPETLEGTCVALCQGSPAEPVCPDGTECEFGGDSVMALCLFVCDPIAQDCPEGHACYPINDDFGCAPDVSGDAGAAGDPCEFINVCDPGTFCLDASAITTCDAAGCCVPVCDVADETADDACAAFDAGSSCEAWYEEGQAPPGYENVGVCVVPS